MILAGLHAASAFAEGGPAQDVIEGEVTGRGAVCVRFDAQGIGPVVLENAPRGIFRDGLRFRLSGDWVTRSRCMEGRVFAVRAHDPLPEAGMK